MKLLFLTYYFFIIFTSFVTAGEYLVRLKDPISFRSFLSQIRDNTRSLCNITISSTFSFGKFRAVTIHTTKNIVAKLRKNSLIADILPNFKFHAFTTINLSSARIDFSTQRNSPRHLARISRRTKLPFNLQNPDQQSDNVNYYYDHRYLGQGVFVYILDSGIFRKHPEFNNRAVFGADFTGEGPGDFNGHGTHVAGLVGSSTYGAAKKATLVEVKVLNSEGLGLGSDVLAGIEYLVNHCKNSFPSKINRKCVANLSLGSIKSSIINYAIQVAIDEGVVFVVAAGNYNVDACSTTPASNNDAITIGAFDDHIDTIAKFTNWGPCVDLFAPGIEIRSLSLDPNAKYVVSSGTSMSTPIAAGVAAIILSEGIPFSKVKQTMIQRTSSDVFHEQTLEWKPGTPNLVLHTGIQKEDDYFEMTQFPVIDLNKVNEELRTYRTFGMDSTPVLDIWRWNNDVTFYESDIRLRKRLLR